MESKDQEKIKIAREYFMRADQGRPDILELFHEDAEIYFPKFGFGVGRNSFLEMVKGFDGTFKFRDGRISRLHIYLDPDYTGEDEARFRWGKNRQW
jgi:ketosteroid isomerase-like protein